MQTKSKSKQDLALCAVGQPVTLRVHFLPALPVATVIARSAPCVFPAGGPRVCSLGSVACVLGLVACEVCSQDRCGGIVAKPLCAPLSGRHRARAVRRAVEIGFDRRSSGVWGKGVGCSPST